MKKASGAKANAWTLNADNRCIEYNLQVAGWEHAS